MPGLFLQKQYKWKYKRCGTANHFLECCTIEGKSDNLKI